MGLVALWLLTAMAVAEESADPGADPHTLLLAHLNDGFAADFARGDAKPMSTGNRGGAVLRPGRFGNGVDIPRGAFGLAYHGTGNFRCAAGTVDFWLKGDFEDPTEDNPRRFYLPFFACGGTGGTNLIIARTQYNQVVASISEAYKGVLSIGFGNSGPTKINDGQWHHLALTWDQGHAALFLDGRRRAWTESPAYPSFSNWSGDVYLGYGTEDDTWYSRSDKKEDYVPFSAQTIIDELRISDAVRYVVDFVPTDREFSTLEVSSGASGGGASPIGLVAGEQSKVIAGTVGGNVLAVDGPGGKAAYLHWSAVPGDYLYCCADGLASRFMGAVACSVKVPWKASDGQRHIIADLRNRSRTGYLLEKRADGELCLSSQEEGRAQTEVTTPAEGLCDGAWHRVKATWHTEGLRLFLDGQQRAVSSEANVVPSALGRHLFIGSSYEAVDQLEGAVADVQLFSAAPG